ncbi:MAG: hypothetical protein Q9226_005353, partial [Calogaya cf. arnoldii]
MSLHYSIGFLLIIGILVSVFNHASGEVVTLEPLWKPFPGQSDVGGCDAHLQNLRDSYSQAIELCRAAIAALVNIEDPKPEDPREGQEWDRQARLAKALFNIETFPIAGVIDEISTDRHAEILQDALGTSDRCYFLSQWALVWQAFDQWVTNRVKLENPLESPDPEKYLCNGYGRRVSAFVQEQAEMLVFCDDGLRKTPTLGNDVQAANARINPGDKLPNSMSVIWMHELMHVWSKPHIYDVPPARQVGSGVIRASKGIGTYGFVECVNLARLVPADAALNADNYQIFATLRKAMVDWTHSFLRDASTLPQEYTKIMGPRQIPNTAMLVYNISPEQCIARVPEIPERPYKLITTATQEGKALLDFFSPIAKEPGFDYIMWGQARELPECLFIFIGWFGPASESLSHHLQYLHSADPSAMLRNPLKAMTIPFHESLYPPSYPELSCELLTWVIPSHLDPTYHHALATQFDQLGIYLEDSQARATDHKPRPLLASHRGWASNLQPDPPIVAAEPSEKTHLFFFLWGDAEKERTWKDGSTNDPYYVSWEENFLKVQREWEGMGMRSESLHLTLENFGDQLSLQKLERRLAKLKEKDPEMH